MSQYKGLVNDYLVTEIMITTFTTIEAFSVTWACVNAFGFFSSAFGNAYAIIFASNSTLDKNSDTLFVTNFTNDIVNTIFIQFWFV